MTEHDNAQPQHRDLTPLDQALLGNLSPRPSTVADVLGRIDLGGFYPDDPPADESRYVRDHLRGLEDYGLVRRTDEREDGSHVWQLTRAGREAIGLE